MYAYALGAVNLYKRGSEISKHKLDVAHKHACTHTHTYTHTHTHTPIKNVFPFFVLNRILSWLPLVAPLEVNNRACFSFRTVPWLLFTLSLSACKIRLLKYIINTGLMSEWWGLNTALDKGYFSKRGKGNGRLKEREGEIKRKKSKKERVKERNWRECGRIAGYDTSKTSRW